MDAQGPSGSAAAQDKDGAHGQHPPAKKFRMTEGMKGIVWQLVLLSNECCRLENEKKWVVCLRRCSVCVLTGCAVFFF